MLVRLLPLFAVTLAAAECNPTPAARKLLLDADQPAANDESRAARRTRLMNSAAAARAGSPADGWVHRAYVQAAIGEYGEGRGEAMEEYEALAAKSPRNAAVLYAAALAQYSRRTPRAIENLNQALAIQPGLAPAHMLLAEIYASRSFRDLEKLRRHYDAYVAACPASSDLSYSYGWLDEPALQKHIAEAARKAISHALIPQPAEYMRLWFLEGKLIRSDQHQALHERMRADLKRLADPGVPRGNEWNTAHREAAETLGEPGIEAAAQGEVARRYPQSTVAVRAQMRQWRESNPRPNGAETDAAVKLFLAKAHANYRALNQRYRLAISPAIVYWRYAREDPAATGNQISEAFDAIRGAMEHDPDASLSSPPIQCEVAEALLKGNLRIDAVPPLVRACIEVTERYEGSGTESDLYPTGKESRARYRDMWYFFAYRPLADAYIRLKQFSNADDILSQLDRIIDRNKPKKDASSEDLFRHAEEEAPLWYLKGQLAEARGRKMDALILYRNSLMKFPVRRPRPDSREVVLADAKRLWAELGGTPQGWNDWAATSSLDKFYAGAGTGNAWLLLARSRPELEVTDTAGRKWKPAELAEKRTFVNMWATWCGPCRDELPFLPQLRDGVKDKESHVVIALNVDDDTALVAPFLKLLKLDLPTTMARAFAYDSFPTMAIPANWIVDGTGTRLFHANNDVPAEWLKAALAEFRGAP